MRERGFEVGKLTATISVSMRMERDPEFSKFVIDSLKRFLICDWGVLDPEDKMRNTEALRDGFRLMGAYIFDGDGTKIWIITEADRSCTTILFPEEY